MVSVGITIAQKPKATMTCYMTANYNSKLESNGLKDNSIYGRH